MRRFLSAALTVLAILFGSTGFFACSDTPTLPPLRTPLRVENWAIQLQAAHPAEVARSGFQLVVMDYSWDGTAQRQYTPSEIQQIKDAGTIPIAYLSVGEAAPYRFYWKPEWNQDPPEWLGPANPNWPDAYIVRFWHPEWQAILRQYVDRIIAQGFAGIFLDGVDKFLFWSSASNGTGEHYPESTTAERMRTLLINLIQYARQKAGPNFRVLPLNGEEILRYDNDSLQMLIDGWVAESLFYNTIHPWGAGDQQWLQIHRFPYLDQLVAAGKPVFSVDYVDDGSGYQGSNKERIEDYRSRALSRGYLPYAARSDQMLDELNIIDGVQP